MFHYDSHRVTGFNVLQILNNLLVPPQQLKPARHWLHPPHEFACVYKRKGVCMNLYICVCVYLLSVCMCVCVCICIFSRIHICTHTNTQGIRVQVPSYIQNISYKIRLNLRKYVLYYILIIV